MNEIPVDIVRDIIIYASIVGIFSFLLGLVSGYIWGRTRR